jgi:hypothetical protein
MAKRTNTTNTTKTPKPDVIADQAAKAEAAKSLGLTLEQAELLAANPDKALEVMATYTPEALAEMAAKAATVASVQLSPGHEIDLAADFQVHLREAAVSYKRGLHTTYAYYVYVILAGMKAGMLYKGDGGKSDRWAKGTLSTLADMAKVNMLEVVAESDAPKDMLSYLSKTATSLAATTDGMGYMASALAKTDTNEDLWANADRWVAANGNPVTFGGKSKPATSDTLDKLVATCMTRMEALGLPMAELINALIANMDDDAKAAIGTGE